MTNYLNRWEPKDQWIGQWSCQSGPVLIKLGGAAIDQAENHPQLFQALCDLHRALQKDGSGVVIIHGGGAAVDRQLDQRGLKTERRDGIRITPPEVVEQVVAVLAGAVNKQVVGHIQNCGVAAVGLCLGDGKLTRCRKAEGYSFDPGCVGEITGGDARLIDVLLDTGFMPVLSSIGFDDQGKPLNINADDVAGALADIFGCRELIFLTDVPGVLDSTGAIIEELTEQEIEDRIASGEIHGGMIPKVRGALQAAKTSGAPVTIASWSDPQSLQRLGRGERTGTRVVGGGTTTVAAAAYAATPWSDLL